MEQFTMRVNKDDLNRLRAIAKQQNRSVNYVLVEIINQFLRGIK